MKQYLSIILMVVLLSISGCLDDTVEPAQTGTIVGQVISDTGYQGEANVTITVTPAIGSRISDTTGQFVFNEVQAGTYAIQASKSGYKTAVQSIEVTAQDTSHVTLTLDKVIELNLPPSMPTLVSPPDGAVLDPMTVIDLVWSSDDPEGDSLNYTVSMFSTDFPDGQVLISNSPEAKIENISVSFGDTYRWQVMVHDHTNPAVYGPVWTFTTEPFPDHPFLFVRNDGISLIYSADLLGNEISLSSSSHNDWRPRMSPMRDKVAFISDRHINPEIFLMDRDGGQVSRLTSIGIAGSDHHVLDFAWFPTADKLAFMRFNKLYVINRDGTGLAAIYTAISGHVISECDITTDASKFALKLNTPDEYNSIIVLLDNTMTPIDTVLSDIPGRSGGLHFSVDGSTLLYTHDISGYEASDGRMLDSRIFRYDIATKTHTDISHAKESGTNDLDPRFSPNNAEVIFTNVSNDGLSESKIVKMWVDGTERTALFDSATMPEWK